MPRPCGCSETSVPTFHPKRKIEMVVEEAVLPRILQAIEETGAHGYTVLPQAIGRGNRGKRTGDPVSGVSGNVMVIVVASGEIAERVVSACHVLLEHYAGVVWTSDVQVLRDEHF